MAALAACVGAGFALGANLPAGGSDPIGLAVAAAVTDESAYATADAATSPPLRRSPAPSPSPSLSPPAPPAGRLQLTAELERLVAAAETEVDDASIAVAVVDEHRRDVVVDDSQVALVPASTAKLPTAAAALVTFGSDHTFVTQAVSLDPVSAEGVVNGDLLLVGAGDPALATDAYHRWAYPARPYTPLEHLADRIAAAGVRHVTGDVLGVAPGFGGEPLADGWPDDYLASYDARYISGLTVNAGLEVQIAGDPPALEQLLLAENPMRQAAIELYRLLEDRDVTVAGGAHSSGIPQLPADFDVVVAEVTSPPLAELLRHTLRESDNHMADTLLHAVGQARRNDGSWNGGEASVRRVLGAVGVDPSGVVMADGSGLSRHNRLSARHLAELDAAMADSIHAAAWSQAMAVTGQAGTLERRLAGTIGSGRFRGKTGTLENVTSLAGSATGEDGRRYHLAVIANDAEGADRVVARALMDRLVLALIADLDGCDAAAVPLPSPSAGPSPAPTPPLGIPDVVYTCPPAAA